MGIFLLPILGAIAAGAFVGTRVAPNHKVVGGAVGGAAGYAALKVWANYKNEQSDEREAMKLGLTYEEYIAQREARLREAAKPRM